MVVAPRIIAEGKTPAQWVAELAGAGVEISEPPCASGTGRPCTVGCAQERHRNPPLGFWPMASDGLRSNR